MIVAAIGRTKLGLLITRLIDYKGSLLRQRAFFSLQFYDDMILFNYMVKNILHDAYILIKRGI